MEKIRKQQDIDTTEEDNKDFNIILEAANNGCSESQADLGRLYEEGAIVAKDAKQAILWYRRSALQGNQDGQYLLGRAYFNGIGLTKYFRQAGFWFNKAAEQDHAKAHLKLGDMFCYGYGIEPNYELARRYYRRASALGCWEAEDKEDTLDNEWVGDELTIYYEEIPRKRIAGSEYEIGDILSDGSVVFFVDETRFHGLASRLADEIPEPTWLDKMRPTTERGKVDWNQAKRLAAAQGQGWYLPTKSEFERLIESTLFNGELSVLMAALEGVDVSQHSFVYLGQYWTQTEVDRDHAWMFDQGFMYDPRPYPKTKKGRVRAIRTF